METTLDRFGRIVIPKNVRDDMGLEAGSILQIEKQGETIILQPLCGEPQVVEREGVLVFTGTPAGDVSSALEEHRTKRLRKIGHGK